MRDVLSYMDGFACPIDTVMAVVRHQKCVLGVMQCHILRTNNEYQIRPLTLEVPKTIF